VNTASYIYASFLLLLPASIAAIWAAVCCLNSVHLDKAGTKCTHIGTLPNALGKPHQMLLRFVELQLDTPAQLHAIYFLPSCLPTGIACTVVGQVSLFYNLSFPAAVNISLWGIIYKAAHFASAKARRCPSLLGKSTASIKEE
jgi:hypothetical protein